jgi:hypothetical protein
MLFIEDLVAAGEGEGAVEDEDKGSLYEDEISLILNI